MQAQARSLPPRPGLNLLPVTFTGTIRPADHDRWGRVTSVLVKPSGRFVDPVSVVVDPLGEGQALLNHPFRVARVTGFVRLDPYGLRTLFVTGFTLQ